MAFKIFTVLIVLFLTQATLGKSITEPTESSELEDENIEDLSAKYFLSVYFIFGFLQLGEQLGEKAANASRQLLQDDVLLANEQAEVIEFKDNLKRFVDNYDDNRESDEIWDILEIYSNTTDRYLQIAKDNMTPESTFIQNLLIKYEHQEVKDEFVKEFDKFVEDFKENFEEVKAELNNPALEWYEKFTNLTEFQHRIDGFEEFVKLT